MTLVIYRDVEEPHWFKPDITCHTLRAGDGSRSLTSGASGASGEALHRGNSGLSLPCPPVNRPLVQQSEKQDVNTASGVGASAQANDQDNSRENTGEDNTANVTSCDANVNVQLPDASERESVDAIFPKLDPVEVELQKKSGKSLGLVIGSRKDASRLPIVLSIVPETLAQANGQIHIGDHLLELNGQNLTSLPYAEVVALMKVSLPPSVSLIISTLA